MQWTVELGSGEKLLTTSLGLTGALRASAISCAFWLMLPLLIRIVRMASLRLFCLPCRVECADGRPAPRGHWLLLFRLACQRSASPPPPLPLAKNV